MQEIGLERDEGGAGADLKKARGTHAGQASIADSTQGA